MRIYNGKNSALDIPLSGMQRIQVSPKSVSGDFLPSTDFLSVLISGYDYSEVALIVSGPFEINLCSSVPGCVGFVVQSLEEAIERFNPKETKEIEPTQEIITEPEPTPTVEERKGEEIIKEEVELEAEPVVIPPAELNVEEEVKEKDEKVEEKEVVKEKKPTKKPAGKKTTKK